MQRRAAVTWRHRAARAQSHRRCRLQPTRSILDGIIRRLTPQPQSNAWWDQGKDAWVELQGLQHWQQELEGGDHRLMLVDWYSPACKGCETAFPALTQVARDEELKRLSVFISWAQLSIYTPAGPQEGEEWLPCFYRFFKASIEHPELKAHAHAQGVQVLPSLTIFEPLERRHLLTLEAPVSRIRYLKLNLQVVQLNPGSDYRLDPNAFVIPVPRKDAAPPYNAADFRVPTSGECNDETCMSIDW